MNSNELRNQMLELPRPITDKQPPFWDYWRRELWDHIVEGDDPNQFDKWPCVYHTMLQNHWPGCIVKEYEILRSSSYYTQFLNPAYLAPAVIGPQDFLPGRQDISMNMLHQFFHIASFENNAPLKLREVSAIVEFGGGYGAMAHLLRRLGFEGDYFIIELPEFSLLQKYYLSEVGADHHTYWLSPDTCPDDLLYLDVDLFMALYSLSEIPIENRDNILNTASAKAHMLLYSNYFASYDNTQYFSEYAKRIGGHWRHWKIDHMPPESWYSMGYRNERS